MIAVAVFNDVGCALDQVEYRLVGVLHEDGGIGTFQGGVVEVNAGVAFVFGTWSVHDHLEVGGFACYIIGAWTGDCCNFVCNVDATVVVLNGGRGACKFQKNLRAVQGVRVIIVVVVIAGVIARILIWRIVVSRNYAAGAVKVVAGIAVAVA